MRIKFKLKLTAADLAIASVFRRLEQRLRRKPTKTEYFDAAVKESGIQTYDMSTLDGRISHLNKLSPGWIEFSSERNRIEESLAETRGRQTEAQGHPYDTVQGYRELCRALGFRDDEYPTKTELSGKYVDLKDNQRRRLAHLYTSVKGRLKGLPIRPPSERRGQPRRGEEAGAVSVQDIASEKRILHSIDISQKQVLNLLNIFEHVQDVEGPVDMLIDTTLLQAEGLSRDDAELVMDNMLKIWALIVLRTAQLDLDVHYVLDRPNGTIPDKTFEEKFTNGLNNAIAATAQKLHADVEIPQLLAQIYNPREEALKIPIVSINNISELKQNEYPVIMEGDGVVDGMAALRNFTAAVGIGLSYAKLALAKIKSDEVYIEAKSRVLPGLFKLYKICGVKESVTGDIIDKFISGHLRTRLFIAQKLALPPAARVAIQYLRQYYDNIRLMLEAA